MVDALVFLGAREERAGYHGCLRAYLENLENLLRLTYNDMSDGERPSGDLQRYIRQCRKAPR